MVADQLRQRILYGQLRAGARIDQDATAHELGVSKIPVREALVQLATEGLIDYFPRRGAFVAEVSTDDVIEHFAIYGALAGRAAARLASSHSDAQIDDMTAILASMDASSDPDELELLNFKFHRVIEIGGGSRRLTALLKSLKEGIPSGFYHANPRWKGVGHRDHKRILRAIRNADADTAATAMAEHLVHSGEFAIELLRSRGWWTDATATEAHSQ